MIHVNKMCSPKKVVISNFKKYVFFKKDFNEYLKVVSFQSKIMRFLMFFCYFKKMFLEIFQSCILNPNKGKAEMVGEIFYKTLVILKQSA